MIRLSQVIDRFHCSKVQASVVDPLLGFGCYLAGAPHPSQDPGLLVDYAEDQAGFLKFAGADKVPGPAQGPLMFKAHQMENDLFMPKVVQDQDKVFRVRLPGFGPVMSTASVERDWRLLVLTMIAVLNDDNFPGGAVQGLMDQTVIMEVYWADRLVMGHVRPSFWPTVYNAISWALMDRPTSAGPACDRCEIRGACLSYEKLLDLPAEEQTKGLSRSNAAQKLLTAYIMARASERAQTERRRTLGHKLAALSRDSRIEVGALFTIPVETGVLERYPYAQTKVFLGRQGLWRDDYGAISLRAFKAAIPGFPLAVKNRLDELKIVETKDPDIKEIVDGVAQSVQAPLLRGISL